MPRAHRRHSDRDRCETVGTALAFSAGGVARRCRRRGCGGAQADGRPLGSRPRRIRERGGQRPSGSGATCGTGDYTNRTAAQELVETPTNAVCDLLGGCFTSISDGRIRDNVRGRAVYHAVFDAPLTGEQGSCPNGFFQFVGSEVFTLPDSSVVNGSSNVMYLNGGAIQYFIVDTDGCIDPFVNFVGFGTQGLVAVGGTGRFMGASGRLDCRFETVGLPGQFAGPFWCEGELSFGGNRD